MLMFSLKQRETHPASRLARPDSTPSASAHALGRSNRSKVGMCCTKKRDERSFFALTSDEAFFGGAGASAGGGEGRDEDATDVWRTRGSTVGVLPGASGLWSAVAIGKLNGPATSRSRSRKVRTSAIVSAGELADPLAMGSFEAGFSGDGTLGERRVNVGSEDVLADVLEKDVGATAGVSVVVVVGMSGGSRDLNGLLAGFGGAGVGLGARGEGTGAGATAGTGNSTSGDALLGLDLFLNDGRP